MPQLAKRLFLASCACLLSLSAQASTHLGVYLKTYYTDFQLVTDCAAHHRLTAADVAKAKDALAKIEAYYLRRDPAINKDKLMKQALANNKVAYKMMAETQKVDPGVFCRSSMNDLMSKLRDIDADATVKKSGS
ncbi:MAG: hypothetical protein WBF49_06835 [Methyloceanibacter sp.]|jgi:methionine synthase II (cobalamin-independent)|uniref:hypothetical protein n=1 Tax=Methyloceanibacter sp. TaxID=1965321 RepID=UPI003BC5F15C